MKFTRTEAAQILNVPVDLIAFKRAASVSIHIAVNGIAFCGRINNDGYPTNTEYEEVSSGIGCKTCLTRLSAKVAA